MPVRLVIGGSFGSPGFCQGMTNVFLVPILPHETKIKNLFPAGFCLRVSAVEILLWPENREQQAGRYGRADNPGNIGTHGMHQEEIGGVFLLADRLGYPCSHGNR